MVKLISSLLTSFILTYLSLPVIISLSKKKNILDSPDRRKIHKGEVPSLGGIAIFLGFIISTIIWISFPGIVEYKYVIVGLCIIFIMGIRDDLIPIDAKIKLLVQIVAALMVVGLSGINFPTLYGLMGIGELPVFISFAITLFTIIVVTNAFNLIDGLDGLAATVSCITLITFGVWFSLVNDLYTPVLTFSMLGAVLAFLTFNWEPAKIFMGDTGALVLGFLFSVLVIHFINTNYNLSNENIYRFNASISTGVCVIIIPLIDTLRIFILRITKKKSPFSPDKSHIHHALMRLGLRHYQTSLVLGGVNLAFIALAVLMRPFGDKIMLPLVLVLAVGFSMLVDFLINRKVKTRKK